TPPAAPPTQPLLWKPVPAAIAIGAGFLGTLLGLCLGIVITITHRDGTSTVIHAPDGSDVSVRADADARNGGEPPTEAKPSHAKNGATSYEARESLSTPARYGGAGRRQTPQEALAEWPQSSGTSFLDRLGRPTPSKVQQTQNHLKQIGLAFHNFHDMFG